MEYIREFDLSKNLLKPLRSQWVNKQRMSIRAEGTHVGTDPVSVRTSANSVYRPHNVFRPVASGADRHGVCTYMRANCPNWRVSLL